MLAVGLGSQLQSIMTDKASVATWEGVLEASSGEVMTLTSLIDCVVVRTT
jgi:hypothetical protein